MNKSKWDKTGDVLVCVLETVLVIIKNGRKLSKIIIKKVKP